MDEIEKMTRTQVIQELAKYSHPSWYHGLLEKDTHTLKILLYHYRSGGSIETTQGEVLRNKLIFKK